MSVRSVFFLQTGRKRPRRTISVRRGFPASRRYLYTLTDGSLLIPFEESGTWRLNLNTQSLNTATRAYDSGIGGYYYNVLDDKVYTFHQGDTSVTVKDILTGTESTLALEDGAPDNNVKNLAAGADGFYFWVSGTGLMKIDQAGNFQVIAGLDQIEIMDGSSFPYNVWNTCVNNQGNFCLYDNSSKSIILIYRT